MPTYVMDRTQSDVDLVLRLSALGYDNMSAAEKALWDAGLKGAYNATDLNRVGNALNYINYENPIFHTCCLANRHNASHGTKRR